MEKASFRGVEFQVDNSTPRIYVNGEWIGACPSEFMFSCNYGPTYIEPQCRTCAHNDGDHFLCMFDKEDGRGDCIYLLNIQEQPIGLIDRFKAYRKCFEVCEAMQREKPEGWVCPAKEEI